MFKKKENNELQDEKKWIDRMKSVKQLFLMFQISECVHHFVIQKTGTDCNE